MPKIIEAIYEDGVFKPLEKVDLKDGEKVRLEIKKDIDRLRGKYKAKLLQIKCNNNYYEM
ncbi:MAG: antitoxin family protein [Archaeoglobaceae archaeon]